MWGEMRFFLAPFHLLVPEDFREEFFLVGVGFGDIGHFLRPAESIEDCFVLNEFGVGAEEFSLVRIPLIKKGVNQVAEDKGDSGQTVGFAENGGEEGEGGGVDRCGGEVVVVHNVNVCVYWFLHLYIPTKC